MVIFDKIRPKFWYYQKVTIDKFKNAGPFDHKPMLSYRRIWQGAILLIFIVATLPLICMAIIDYNVTRKAIDSEFNFQTARLVSNTKRTLSFFIAEHKSALTFILHNSTLEELNNPKQLAAILENLKKSFGGFADLGVIDFKGRQKTYVGSYNLEGKNYSSQEWFKQIQKTGSYVSDVFMGFRNVPHAIIAIKRDLPNGSFFVLRAALDIKLFNEILSNLNVSASGDAFVINHEGILQTPTRNHGKILEKLYIPVPEFSPKTVVLKKNDPAGKHLLIGYAYIIKTPFILMVIKQEKNLMQPWSNKGKKLIWFMVVSIAVILIVTFSVTTYLVDKMYIADLKRLRNLHLIEYSSKMASIGRLSAGVAHEINNPLAIINEKAGLIQDLFVFTNKYADDPKLLELVNSIIASVERCGLITKQLLNFARNDTVRIKPVNLEEAIKDVLTFLGKEAEVKCITVSIDMSDNVPCIKSDGNKLQQIFLNLINNAFAAMDNGGTLHIKICKKNEKIISLTFADSGIGISQENLKHIFEPFFSTKTLQDGTGLGLSITYELIQEIEGDITVTSKVGKGTTFTVFLPVKIT